MAGGRRQATSSQPTVAGSRLRLPLHPSRWMAATPGLSFTLTCVRVVLCCELLCSSSARAKAHKLEEAELSDRSSAVWSLACLPSLAPSLKPRHSSKSSRVQGYRCSTTSESSSERREERRQERNKRTAGKGRRTSQRASSSASSCSPTSRFSLAVSSPCSLTPATALEQSVRLNSHHAVHFVRCREANEDPR